MFKEFDLEKEIELIESKIEHCCLGQSPEQITYWQYKLDQLKNLIKI